MTENIGYAALQIIPSMRGFRTNLDRQVRGPLSSTGRSGGTVFRGGFLGALGGMGPGIVAAMGLGAVVGALKSSVMASADFEQRIDAIGAVSNASEKQISALSRKALKLGEDTAFGASESAAAMEELVKSGLSIKDVLNGGADAAVALAAAGGVDVPVAAELAANAMNVFNIEAAKMPAIADVIAGAANATSTDIGLFGQSLVQSSAVAKLSGLSFEDLSLGIGAMAEAGMTGSDAGTSLKSMLLQLTPQTSSAEAAMHALGLMTEDNTSKFYDANGELKSLTEMAGLLQKGMERLSERDRNEKLKRAFGTDAIRAASSLAAQGAEGMKGLREEMSKISAEGVAEKRLDNFAGAMEQLGGAFETLRIRVGDQLAPMIREAAEYLTDNMPAIRKAVVGFVRDAVKWIRERLIPAFHGIKDWWDRNGDKIVTAVKAWAKFVGAAFTGIVDGVSWLTRAWQTLVDKVQLAQARMMLFTLDWAIKSSHLAARTAADLGMPELAQDLLDRSAEMVAFREGVNRQMAKITERKTIRVTAAFDAEDAGREIGDFIQKWSGSSIKLKGGFTGDGIGMVSAGGPAMARAQAAAVGLPVTMSSGYRPGAITASGNPSFHGDQSDPASDWIGPTWALDLFAARLRAMGQWRELLWRVPNHAPGDNPHVHVADDGGVYKGPGYVWMGAGRETFASGLAAQRVSGWDPPRMDDAGGRGEYRITRLRLEDFDKGIVQVREDWNNDIDDDNRWQRRVGLSS